MSRIGKLPITVPEKVQVKLGEENFISVKGPKGELSFNFPKGVVFTQEKAELKVTVESDKEKNLWGLSRTLLFNMVTGVTDGFTKDLEFNGVGYKAVAKGKTLTLNLGYSHPIDYELPEGIEAAVKGNKISISGCNKETVGRVAAKVRSFRPPEPYKGKGIKYADEVIIRKAGKTGGKK